MTKVMGFLEPLIVKPGLKCPVCGDLRIPFKMEGGGLGCTKCKTEGRDDVLTFNIPPRFEVKVGRYISYECIDTSIKGVKSSIETHLKWEVYQTLELSKSQETIEFECIGKGFKTQALSGVRQGDIISFVIRTDEGRPGPYHFKNLTTGLDYPLHESISTMFRDQGDRGKFHSWSWKNPHSKELNTALDTATTNLQAPISVAIQTSKIARELLRGTTSLVKIYVVSFRSDFNRLMYPERARTALGISPGARVVGITPSDETFSRRAIESVCGDISLLSLAPEVKVESDDGYNAQFNPSVQMESYAADFLRRKISKGEDPDYFHVPGYNVQAMLSTDRLSGDYAIVIRIHKTW